MNKKTTKKAAPKKTSVKKAATKKTAKRATKKATKATPRVASRTKKKVAVPKAAPKRAAKAAGSTGKSTRKPAAARKKVSTVEPAASPVVPKKVKGLPKKQIEHFRQKLLVEKQRVLEEMGDIASNTLKKSISDQSGENSRYSYHLGDVASLSYGREFSMGLAERQQKYLEQIDDALQRMEDGSYGVCLVTGELIPSERLEEVPIAKYSVRGKELLEQQKRHGYDARRMMAPGVTDEQRRAYELVTGRSLSPRQ